MDTGWMGQRTIYSFPSIPSLKGLHTLIPYKHHCPSLFPLVSCNVRNLFPPRLHRMELPADFDNLDPSNQTNLPGV